mmetsp:Transcript_1076/g.3658  ORF Transcript_1076/g.3658 Transcript_1076/m.3658 type:complete len:98 (-) Transcript_1076:21-314(-)
MCFQKPAISSIIPLLWRKLHWSSGEQNEQCFGSFQQRLIPHNKRHSSEILSEARGRMWCLCGAPAWCLSTQLLKLSTPPSECINYPPTHVSHTYPFI